MKIKNWVKVTNDNHPFNCDHWDCPHKIQVNEIYYIERYDDGHSHMWCLECAAYFMAGKLNRCS